MLTTMQMVAAVGGCGWPSWRWLSWLGAAARPGLGRRRRVLTAQDVVSIKVVNQPDMDTTTRVETDGTISFPYVGRIRAAGLTEDQVAHSIERQLASRQIVTEPHVLVEITTFGTQASVQGQVGAPGVYTLDRPTTLTQLLSRAGGVGTRAWAEWSPFADRAAGSSSSSRRMSRRGAAPAPICELPTMMRFLSTCLRSSIYTGMSVTRASFLCCVL